MVTSKHNHKIREIHPKLLTVFVCVCVTFVFIITMIALKLSKAFPEFIKNCRIIEEVSTAGRKRGEGKEAKKPIGINKANKLSPRALICICGQ